MALARTLEDIGGEHDQTSLASLGTALDTTVWQGAVSIQLPPVWIVL